MSAVVKEGRWAERLMACVEAGETKLPAIVQAIGAEEFGRTIARYMQSSTEPKAAYDELVARTRGG